MQAPTHSGAQAPAIVLNPIRAGLPVCDTLEVLVRVQAPPASSVGDDSAYLAADRRRHGTNHLGAMCAAIGNITLKTVQQNSFCKK